MRLDPRRSPDEQAGKPLGVCCDENRISEMKKTRELTATHYRRSLKRSASGNVQNVDLQLHCPICGARLDVNIGKNSEEKDGATPAHVCSPMKKGHHEGGL